MGLLDRLFKKPTSQLMTSPGTVRLPPPRDPSKVRPPLILADYIDVPLGGDEILYVVGESYRQDALWRLVGGTRLEEVREECVAQLIPEPTNQYDGNAIAVFIRDDHVGYLSRSDAAAYLPGLKHLIEESRSGRVTLQPLDGSYAVHRSRPLVWSLPWSNEVDAFSVARFDQILAAARPASTSRPEANAGDGRDGRRPLPSPSRPLSDPPKRASVPRYWNVSYLIVGYLLLSRTLPHRLNA